MEEGCLAEDMRGLGGPWRSIEGEESRFDLGDCEPAYRASEFLAERQATFGCVRCKDAALGCFLKCRRYSCASCTGRIGRGVGGIGKVEAVGKLRGPFETISKTCVN